MREIARRFEGLIWGNEPVPPPAKVRRRRALNRAKKREPAITPAQRRLAGLFLAVFMLLFVGMIVGAKEGSPGLFLGCLGLLLILCIAECIYVRITEGYWPNENGAHFW